MDEHGDNLVDLVETLQKYLDKMPEADEKPKKIKKGEWQVVDKDGNVITLLEKKNSLNGSSFYDTRVYPSTEHLP